MQLQNAVDKIVGDRDNIENLVTWLREVVARLKKWRDECPDPQILEICVAIWKYTCGSKRSGSRSKNVRWEKCARESFGDRGNRKRDSPD